MFFRVRPLASLAATLETSLRGHIAKTRTRPKHGSSHVEWGRRSGDTGESMIRSTGLLRALMMLVALAIIAMPASGVHLHLCFDGAEVPTSLHLSEDGGSYHSDGAGHVAHTESSAHTDADLELGAPAIAKKADGALDLPSLITVAVLFLRLPAATPAVLPETDDPSIIVRSAYRILPPLRAPPV